METKNIPMLKLLVLLLKILATGIIWIFVLWVLCIQIGLHWFINNLFQIDLYETVLILWLEIFILFITAAVTYFIFKKHLVLEKNKKRSW